MRPYVKGANAAGTVYGDSEKVMLGEVTGGCDWYRYQSDINGQGDSDDAAVLAHFKTILGLRRGDVATLLVDDAGKL